VSADDRLDRLEQRVAVLETLVRQLAMRGEKAATLEAAPAAEGLPWKGGEASAGDQGSSSAPFAASPLQGDKAAAPAPVASRPAAAPPPPSRPATPLPRLDEQWIGQRGLLAVGVFALLMAAGYLLKLSFDRGWIPPIMRCLGGVLAGVAVGGLGWRLQERYRTYGAALIGCGAGIIYLSVWAACRLYEVIPSTTGIMGLALVSIALATIAYAIDVQALGATAALGAFMAPVLLGREHANADLLLLYLASMAAGLGLVAARKRWRLAMFVVAASYFGVGTVGAGDYALPGGVLVYGLVGGSVGLYVGLREKWWETRLLTFSGGWVLLAAASERLAPHWPVFLAGIVLSAPVWWHALRAARPFPLQPEAVYFFATPLLLGWSMYGLAPRQFDATPGLLPILVAVPYLLAGYLRPLPHFALVGAAATAIAAAAQWEGLPRVWALLGLALLWPALDHWFHRWDGRWYGLITLAVALQHLFDTAWSQRTAADAAFVGPWALGLWGGIVATAALAAGLWRLDSRREDGAMVRVGLWSVAGLMALFGVTREIRRFFELRLLSAETANLAGGLAVSAWWLVFAAALVSYGFRGSVKALRVAGLAVAGLAIVKVIFYDLSSLDALYRVGSVFLLGLVTLSLAYLYYRFDREGRGERV
jgi:uncharacterized membrane protein